MAVHITIPKAFIKNSNPNSAIDKNAVVHFVPFHIRKNGDAPISKYFTPTIRKLEDGDLKSSFRGRPITGRVCDIPDGYSGYVIKEKTSTDCENQERNVHVTGKFSKFYYWDNKTPPKNVALLAVLGLTTLIHSPTDSS